MHSLEEVKEMRNQNVRLLAAASALALMMTTTTANATFFCSWVDGIKVCGTELGFAPSTDRDSSGTDRHKRDGGERENNARESGHGDNRGDSEGNGKGHGDY